MPFHETLITHNMQQQAYVLGSYNYSEKGGVHCMRFLAMWNTGWFSIHRLIFIKQINFMTRTLVMQDIREKPHHGVKARLSNSCSCQSKSLTIYKNYDQFFKLKLVPLSTFQSPFSPFFTCKRIQQHNDKALHWIGFLTNRCIISTTHRSELPLNSLI